MAKYKSKPITNLSSELLRWSGIERANRWAKMSTEPLEPEAQPPVPQTPPPASVPVKKRSSSSGTKKRPRKKTRHLSPAHRAKISAAVKGRKKTTAHRAKISAALKGHKTPAAVRAKIRAALRGRLRPEAVKAKISVAKRGKPLSPQHRAKISLALRGERSPAYKHGLYATPTFPIHTPEDVVRALKEKQARLAALLDQPLSAKGFDLDTQIGFIELSLQNLYNLYRLQRDKWKAQADAEAAEKLADDLLREMEAEAEKEKERMTEEKPDGE